jgi:hypothetical protein
VVEGAARHPYLLEQSLDAQVVVSTLEEEGEARFHEPSLGGMHVSSGE